MRVYKINKDKKIEDVIDEKELDGSTKVKRMWDGNEGYYKEDFINKVLEGGAIKDYLKQALESEKNKEEINSLNGDIEYLQNKNKLTKDLIIKKEEEINKVRQEMEENINKVDSIIQKIDSELE